MNDSAKKAPSAQGRVERWSQKLLDFSARNRLLNIPANSRQILPLLCADVGVLQDKLAADETITIRALVETIGEKTYAEWQKGELSETKAAELFRETLARRQLCADLTSKEVRKRLTDLYHDAKTAVEESGVNTLFLAIGTLQWIEPGNGANRKSYRAPILMVPVRMERPSMAEGVKMYRLDEETSINTTLVEFLRSQFGVTLNGLDPLPTDDAGVDVHRVLEVIRDAVRDLAGWTVNEDTVIGCFSFGKFVMWKDMTGRVEELKRHPLVNHLIGGGGAFDDGVEVFDPEDVARHLQPGEFFCPVSADSSQLTAVLYSERGKTFVLHGPPGTGKSQTITNIIADNLAKGRRVLFVSEKKAALDVVKARLDKIGLTPFCLELHSNKTEKRRFYEQIKSALDVAESGVPGEWEQTVADFSKYREELNAYARALHQAYPNGLTPYSCFVRAIQYGANARTSLIGVDCLVHPREAYRDARQSVIDLLADFRAVSETALQAMPELNSDTWSPALERQLKTAAETLGSAADAMIPVLAEVMEVFGRGETPSLVSVTAFVKDYGELEKRLARYRLDQLVDCDLDSLGNRLAANRQSFCLIRYFKNRSLLKAFADVARPEGEPLTVERLAEDLESMRVYQSAAKRLLAKTGRPAVCEMPAALQTLVEKFLGLWQTFLARHAGFLEIGSDALWREDVRAVPAACAAIAANLEELRGVMRYRKTLAVARGLGMGAFADYVFENDDGTLDIASVFDDSYAAKMLESVLNQTPVLAEFTGLTQDERIEKFRALDRKYTELCRQVVFAKLAATLPRRRNGPCPDGTELGMVKRECEKKTRQKAVRQILADSRTLIPTLKPCFLMSPLSVAQYLPVDAEPFDLIVFDEASQIPVWDAIGVIARGRQLIVVGDPKQMPPTNFFQKGESEDEDEASETIEDQESILDECLVAGVSSTYLNWHYRSRHESLIAFSNAHYYENRLCTFPSAANSPRLGVKFMFVEGGVCEKSSGGAKTNRVEAKALVDYICGEITKPGYTPRSIGVVTFSLPQQKLIQTMIDERREADAEIERLLPEEGPNAYFVKNLENVQGDESDVILFSVGFAPDESGKFAMNFGPLNRSGGERRLNVAVTRSKEQVVVFSSIRSSQIDAGEDGRTKAVGAEHLKAFLEYAERGVSARVATASEKDGGGFGDVVSAFLRSHGYEVVRDVGCSQYRIDVAVCDPETPRRYLLGIECDGPAYAGQRTAQDRDVNRAGVLRGLGWRMCRVWSLDWALDRRRAEERLLQLLASAKSGAEDSKSASEPKPVTDAAKPASVSGEAAAPSAPVSAHPAYVPWKSSRKYASEKFYDEMSVLEISWMLKAVIETEGPVCDAALRKRVAQAWGLTRITEKVNRQFEKCLPRDCTVTRHETGVVWWPPEQDPGAYHDYRVPSEDESSKRSVEELPPEEVANAMREALAELGRCPQDDLYRDMVRTFALGSLTAKVRRHLDVAYSMLS